MRRKIEKFMLPALRGRRMALAAMFVVFGVLALGLVVMAPKLALCLAMAVPLLGVVMPEEEFQTKVLKGVEELAAEQKTHRNRFDQVASELDRADKEVKKALEDLTRVKNTVNDFDAGMKEMRKVQLAIARNARSSWRDPVARALEDEGLRVFLNAAARAACFPAELSRLPAEFRKALEEASAAHKSLTGVDSSLGQATIPSEYFKTIYDTLSEYGEYTTLEVLPVGARTNLLPVATARPTFYWLGAGTGGAHAEGSAITEGALAGSSVTLSIQTLAVYLTVARELLQDSSVDMAPYIMRQLLQSLAYGLDWVAFAADGTADQTDAGYYGLFYAASENTELAAAATAGNTTMEATELEDWQRVLLTVNPIVLRRKANWWMHPQMLIRTLAVRDKNGRPLFQTYTEAPQPGGIGSILGYPVKLPLAAPSTNSAGAPVAVFGDPMGKTIGIRQDMEFATSDDIKFAENMRAFRGLVRAGSQTKTTTGSTTLKPFGVLTLAAV
jgi:HK97 family phage major capsid protein